MEVPRERVETSFQNRAHTAPSGDPVDGSFNSRSGVRNFGLQKGLLGCGTRPHDS
jgi:hypothetical protein